MKYIQLFFFLLVFQTGFSQEDIFDVARKGTVEQVKTLQTQNPDIINTVNEQGFTPLLLACYRGNLDVAKFLIENSKTIDTTSDMGTPLMACVVKGDSVLARLLLQKGANPNLTDSKGTTALIYAVEFQNIETVQLLLKYNADKTHKNNEGKTAFEFAVFSGNEAIINLLKLN